MRTLLFEMKPRDGHEEHYFAHVKRLRPIVTKQQGLLFIERYKSLHRSGVILSHSLWRDENSMAQWRCNKEHLKSQRAGRDKHFEDYRIRISRSLYVHGTAVGEEEQISLNHTKQKNNPSDRIITIIRSSNLSLIDCLENYESIESYKSVTQTNSFLSVMEFSEQALGYEQCVAALAEKSTMSTILASVSRDYGMHDRSEAPTLPVFAD